MNEIIEKKIKYYYDTNWLDFVVDTKKVKRCKCNLLKSSLVKGCPHLTVPERESRPSKYAK